MKKGLMAVLIILLAMMVFVGCEGDTSPVETEDNDNGEEAAAEETDTEEEEDEADEADEEAADEETDAGDEEEGVEGAENSRTTPAGIGERFLVEKDDWVVGKVDYEIEMIDIISGEEALEMVRQANEFNEEPEEGQEYVLAEFEITVLETEEDDAFDLWMGISWSAVSGEGREYDEFFSVSGIEKLEEDLYEGATAVGYQPFIVDEDDENPVAAHDRREPTELWFDLRGDQ